MVDVGLAAAADVRSARAFSAAATTPVTFGQVFRRGDVPSGHTLIAETDGQALPTQVDAKATWSDGSLRHAVITVAPGSASEFALYSADSDRNSLDAGDAAVQIGDLLATSFDARLEITQNGSIYVANARDALTAAVQSGDCPAWEDRRCRQWLSGPLASEWIVPAALVSGSQTNDRLQVYFHVRAYRSDGRIDNVRVDTVVENALAYGVTPQNRHYNAEITVGANRYSVADLTQYRQSRWHRILWSANAPSRTARIDTDYLQSTRAISNYATLTPSDDLLDSVRQDIEPMTHGDQTKSMGNTGAQAAIGPLPQWTSAYVVSSDPRAYRWMLANDDAVGSYSFHYRDGETGRPLEITRHPYVTLANWSYASNAGGRLRDDLLPGCPSDCDSPLSFDISHHPSIGYVPYLVSGDYYYLEELQFTASYVQLWANQHYRDYDKGQLLGAQGQVRGQAWAMRSISDAAFATPDTDPLKSYFTDQIEWIIEDYVESFVNDDEGNPFHVIDNWGAVIYPANGQSRVGVGPWQADFLTWSVGHVAEQQVEGAAKLLAWLSRFQVDRMTDWQSDPEDGYCWIVASTYSLQIRPAKGAENFPDIATAYKAAYPELSGLPCGGQEMANVLSRDGSRRYAAGEMVGYADSATGFTSNLQIGLAMAAGSGITKATEAWRVFDERSVKPNYDDYPNFAVVPR